MLDWATGIIERTGYLGVVFAMFLENVFPPIPSELVMLFAGASASRGDMHLAFLIMAGVLGSALGLLPWYYLGRWYGLEKLGAFAEKYGRWLTFSKSDIDRSDEWFARHGKKAVFLGRFLPAIRTLIAIPAALTNMKLSTFLVYALLGSSAYDGSFAVLGYYAGENAGSIERYINIGLYITLAIVGIWYLYRVVTFEEGH